MIPQDLAELTDAVGATAVDAGRVVANFGVTLACSLLLSLLYRKTYRGTSYSPTFTSSLVTLALVTAMIMMVIGNSLARAFGLVGAMSIIRFRTAIKEPQDIVYIFLSLAIGLAAGVGYHLLAVLGTLTIGTTLLLLARTNYASPTRREYLLQLQTSFHGPNGSLPYGGILERHCASHRVMNVRALGDNRTEVSYLVHLKRPADAGALVQELQSVRGTDHVNLFFDEEGM